MAVLDDEISTDLSPELYDGLAGFRLALRRFLTFSDTALAKADITSQQYQAMLVIKTAPDGHLMMRELAEQMLMRPHGAVQLVDRLVSSGYASRTSAQHDRRSTLIGLTSSGHHALALLARSHLDGLLANEVLLVESLSKLRKLNHVD